MPTTTRQPDGTVSTYTVTNPATWAALQSLKPMRKPRAKADKRRYPQWRADMSTADYINQYFGLNSSVKIAAYPRYETNWLALYAPLPDTPAAWAPDTVEIEILE
jgi:hypothetical protein